MANERYCPDGGTCHHNCMDDAVCFRVKACGPLTGSRSNEFWNVSESEQLNGVDIDKVRIVTAEYDETDQYSWGKESVCHVLDIRKDDEGFMYIQVDAKEFDPNE